MLNQLRKLMKPRPKNKASSYRPVSVPPPPQLVLTEASLAAVRNCMADEIEIGFEGIAYLFGMTNGATTLVIGAMRPEARTTPGSFDVSPVAMARVVRKANDAGLQVVGQIHTHPRQAFHSGGDEDGARIAYDGYVSIVVPDYGRHLPALTAAAAYFFRSGAFLQIGRKALTVVNGSF